MNACRDTFSERISRLHLRPYGVLGGRGVHVSSKSFSSNLGVLSGSQDSELIDRGFLGGIPMLESFYLAVDLGWGTLRESSVMTVEYEFMY